MIIKMSIKVDNLTNCDYKKICRTCLKEGDLICIHETSINKVGIIEMFISCTNLQIKIDDELPQKICFDCVKEIHNAYKFAKKCQVAEQALKYYHIARMSKTQNFNKSYDQGEVETQPVVEFEDITINMKQEVEELKESVFVKVENCENNYENTNLIDDCESNNQISYNNDPLINLNNDQFSKLYNKNKSPPYTCQFCDLIFYTYKEYVEHRRKHPANKRRTAKCSICQKYFSTKSHLKLHMVTHTKERAFICSFCGKDFAHEKNMTRHMKIHTGERPYKCLQCGTKFTRKAHLERHMRIHTGEKRHNCSYCGKSFSAKGNLTVHERIHTLKTPFVCSFCNKGFNDSSSLKKHKRIHFKDKTV